MVRRPSRRLAGCENGYAFFTACEVLTRLGSVPLERPDAHGRGAAHIVGIEGHDRALVAAALAERDVGVGREAEVDALIDEDDADGHVVDRCRP